MAVPQSLVDKACTNKNKYSSESAAEGVAKWEWSRQGIRIFWYKCQFCDGYHLTKRDPRLYEFEQRKKRELEALQSVGVPTVPSVTCLVTGLDDANRAKVAEYGVKIISPSPDGKLVPRCDIAVVGVTKTSTPLKTRIEEVFKHGKRPIVWANESQFEPVRRFFEGRYKEILDDKGGAAKVLGEKAIKDLQVRAEKVEEKIVAREADAKPVTLATVFPPNFSTWESIIRDDHQKGVAVPETVTKLNVRGILTSRGNKWTEANVYMHRKKLGIGVCKMENGKRVSAKGVKTPKVDAALVPEPKKVPVAASAPAQPEAPEDKAARVLALIDRAMNSPDLSPEEFRDLVGRIRRGEVTSEWSNGAIMQEGKLRLWRTNVFKPNDKVELVLTVEQAQLICASLEPLARFTK